MSSMSRRATATELTPHDGEVKFCPGPWAADGSGFHLLTTGREFVGVPFHGPTRGGEWLAAPEWDVDERAGRPTAGSRVVENDKGVSRVRAATSTQARRREPKLPRGRRPVSAPACRSRPTGRGSPSPGTSRRDRPSLRRRHRDRRRAPGHRGAGAAGRRARLDPSLVRYPSFDGREIPAWLYRPDGDGPAPSSSPSTAVRRPRSSRSTYAGSTSTCSAAASACSRRTSAARRGTARATRS